MFKSESVSGRRLNLQAAVFLLQYILHGIILYVKYND